MEQNLARRWGHVYVPTPFESVEPETAVEPTTAGVSGGKGNEAPDLRGQYQLETGWSGWQLDPNLTN